MFGETNRQYGEPGYYGRRMGHYLAERVRGGAAAVICGQTAVHPTTAYQMPNNAQAWSEESVPHFSDLTELVHDAGGLAFIQLTHNGAVNHGPWSKLPVWAPSAGTHFYETSKPLEKHEIRELVEYHALSAANACRGGFDGVEIQAAHGYLIHQFLSPRYNQRDDEYGGSVENRIRFCVEVLEAVREAVASFGVAVGLRLVGDEESPMPGALSQDDSAEIAIALEATGLADFFNVSTGVSGIGMVKSNYAPHEAAMSAISNIRKAVSRTPILAVQRIITPEEAEGILERGEADGITLVRALIADPQWVNKAREGSSASIRRCTGSNQSCLGNMMSAWPVGCVQNPAVGREEVLGTSTLEPAIVAKKVVVVGGGPGGLEAAWVAAARGHEVVLLERADELGGKIRLAQSLPGREELRYFADWRAEECDRQGVDIRLGTTATAEDVLAFEPDAVVVATGGRATVTTGSYYHPMPVEGSEQDWVLDHETALRAALELSVRGAGQQSRLGRRVVILDAVGHIEAIGLGELLAGQGVEVTTVTSLPSPIALDYETAATALPRAVQAGMRWRPNTLVASVDDHRVTLMDVNSFAQEVIEDVDTFVVRTHGTPVDDLYRALDGRVNELVRVGDALSVRYCDRAIHDGHLAGRSF
jgi:2,4-dienoyl-CoA reductase-like NADH-dependent reductase (Old Yellow Enzyme family)